MQDNTNQQVPQPGIAPTEPVVEQPTEPVVEQPATSPEIVVPATDTGMGQTGVQPEVPAEQQPTAPVETPVVPQSQG